MEAMTIRNLETKAITELRNDQTHTLFTTNHTWRDRGSQHWSACWFSRLLRQPHIDASVLLFVHLKYTNLHSEMAAKATH